MRITRREFVAGASVLVLAGSALLQTPFPAFAQGPTQEELMRPGPLPELSLGKEDAPVTIIEYASMTCPHCANFHKSIYPALKAKYIDTGKVRFIFREFPLDDIAIAASMLARCVTPDKAMALIEVLFASQDTWAVRQPIPPLMQIVRQAGFTQKTFDDCLNNTKLYNDVIAVRERGSKQFKVEWTPTLFVNGSMLPRGEGTLEGIEKRIESLLKS